MDIALLTAKNADSLCFLPPVIWVIIQDILTHLFNFDEQIFKISPILEILKI